ncbi:MAG: hypothetical protein J5679_01300 [Alphaproteobacteria bacterium]|nr:hypothetical protein [Alphaproteobacteria bacterium]
MTKTILSLFLCVGAMLCGPAFSAVDFVCGDGYVLASHSKIDGVNAMECRKLWCRDLETGEKMGDGNTANSGYVATDEPVRLEDFSTPKNTITCFGDRKWCAGEKPGVWNAKYGAYTREGIDSATYKSIKKGGCFTWRLEKPTCADGMTAILIGDEWECRNEVISSKTGRSSTVRRTGSVRMP